MLHQIIMVCVKISFVKIVLQYIRLWKPCTWKPTGWKIFEHKYFNQIFYLNPSFEIYLQLNKLFGKVIVLLMGNWTQLVNTKSCVLYIKIVVHWLNILATWMWTQCKEFNKNSDVIRRGNSTWGRNRIGSSSCSSHGCR